MTLFLMAHILGLSPNSMGCYHSMLNAWHGTDTNFRFWQKQSWFGQKQRFYERKPKNGHLNFEKIDKSQYTEKFP